MLIPTTLHFANAQDGAPQQPTSPPQKTIADYAREYRGDQPKATPTPLPPQAQRGKSLSELAAEQRSKHKAEVKLSEKEIDELLKDMGEITDFASSDTGFAEYGKVKHEIVSQEDVKRHWAAALSDSEAARRIERSELVLKKFGYLPHDFTLKKFIVDNAAEGLGGFYDPKTKTMNLVNWVGVEEQRPIMAHELTHALQDQNFDLSSWERKAFARGRGGSMRVESDEAQESDARRAVIEGQAMVVFFDYLLKPYGRTLADTPSAMDFINARLTESYDNSLVVHNAPLLFKESALFPYREGLLFELELLKKGGTRAAFTEVYSHPPLDTHQILEPKAYFDGERIPPVVIPDISAILGSGYEPYDTGTIGQLDVRVMSEQFGSDNDMFTITPGWKGGSYVAVKRASGNSANPTTADIALIYVSRWKDAESAQRFADLYRKSLSKRVTVSGEQQLDHVCAGGECALSGTRVTTNEGPAFIEIWPGHTVLVTHSLEDGIVTRLRARVLVSHSEAKVDSAPELSQKIQDLPAVQGFRSEIERQILNGLTQQKGGSLTPSPLRQTD